MSAAAQQVLGGLAAAVGAAGVFFWVSDMTTVEVFAEEKKPAGARLQMRNTQVLPPMETNKASCDDLVFTAGSAELGVPGGN